VPSEQISWVLVISARQEMKQPTHRTSIFSALLMMSVLLNARVLAQTATDWSRCIGGEGPIVDVVIEGCTAEIQAARDGSQKLPSSGISTPSPAIPACGDGIVTNNELCN
jgi:hypothetical protein